MRLQKWMSHLGMSSRREAERWISEGRVRVNGKLVTELGLRFDPSCDSLKVEGVRTPKLPSRIYWMMNKPDGFLVSRGDPEGRDTIFDLPAMRNIPFRVSSIGRLDYRTEGLLLMSNDGELVHRLTHPKYEIARTYNVLLPSKLSDEGLAWLRGEPRLSDGRVRNLKIKFLHRERLGATRGSWYELTVHEGRNRLVRRLFEALDYRVLRLVRTSFAGIHLPPRLKPGYCIALRPSHIEGLKRKAHL